LGHRLDQLETLLRDREAELDRMKQRILQQPGTRIENELRQQLENAEQDKRKLQENIDLLRKSAEAEKQQQLNTFNEENRQQRMTIEYLQKELSDRQILLSSQNEKISQLDNQLKSVDAKPTTVLKRDEEIGALHKELNETRNEVDRLLKIVQNLEKEKSSLLSKIDDGSPRRLV
jgi:chromosome segregation ATPase